MHGWTTWVSALEDAEGLPGRFQVRRRGSRFEFATPQDGRMEVDARAFRQALETVRKDHRQRERVHSEMGVLSLRRGRWDTRVQITFPLTVSLTDNSGRVYDHPIVTKVNPEELFEVLNWCTAHPSEDDALDRLRARLEELDVLDDVQTELAAVERLAIRGR